MGLIKVWSTSYPATIDDRITTFPLLTDGVDDVIASHPNELADAVIVLEQESAAYKNNSVITAATGFSVDLVDVEMVMGGFTCNGATLANLIPQLRAVAVYNLNGGAAQGELNISIYDLGAPGTPLLPPERRSMLVVPNTDDGVIVRPQQVLTLTASPIENGDEIHNSQRIYEVRAYIDGGPVGATAFVHWAGLALGITQ